MQISSSVWFQTKEPNPFLDLVETTPKVDAPKGLATMSTNSKNWASELSNVHHHM
jgi:hypothetical protein